MLTPQNTNSPREYAPSSGDAALGSRRAFMAQSTLAAGSLLLAGSCLAAGQDAARQTSTSRQATGTRVGEITPHSAIVWTRITAAAERNNAGVVITDRAERPAQPAYEYARERAV